jgi:hypothetical protein
MDAASVGILVETARRRANLAMSKARSTALGTMVVALVAEFVGGKLLEVLSVLLYIQCWITHQLMWWPSQSGHVPYIRSGARIFSRSVDCWASSRTLSFHGTTHFMNSLLMYLQDSGTK